MWNSRWHTWKVVCPWGLFYSYHYLCLTQDSTQQPALSQRRAPFTQLTGHKALRTDSYFLSLLKERRFSLLGPLLTRFIILVIMFIRVRWIVFELFLNNLFESLFVSSLDSGGNKDGGQFSWKTSVYIWAIISGNRKKYKTKQSLNWKEYLQKHFLNIVGMLMIMTWLQGMSKQPTCKSSGHRLIYFSKLHPKILTLGFTKHTVL